MGRLSKGLNGSFTGKVGDVIGSSHNGIPYIKGPYKKRTAPAGEGETKNRSKFSATHHWLKPLLAFVREGFKGYSQTSQGFNAAKSYLSLNAFEGTGAGQYINPALVKVSFGNLPLSPSLAVEQIEAATLKFTWDPAELEDAHRDDQIMMLAYDVDNKDAWFTITGQFRKTGSDVLNISSETGKTYQIYAAFNAADRSRQSNSVYLGEISI